MARDKYRHKRVPERKLYTTGEEYRTLSIRIPIPLWRTLTKLAKLSKRSLNGMVNHIIELVIYQNVELLDLDIELEKEQEEEESDGI